VAHERHFLFFDSKPKTIKIERKTMNVKTHNWKCRGCGSRISVTYTTQTVVIGWSSEEVWPDTNQFICPVCGFSLRQSKLSSDESLNRAKS